MSQLDGKQIKDNSISLNKLKGEGIVTFQPTININKLRQLIFIAGIGQFTRFTTK
jgi:hypothetical protein